MARAMATARPAAVKIAEPAVVVRPSLARCQPATVCGSPALTGAIRRADRLPSTNVGLPGRSASDASAPMPPGQSSAAHTYSGRTHLPEPASSSPGHQTSADKSRPATCPTRMRSPSPGRDPARRRSTSERGVFFRVGPQPAPGASGAGVRDRDGIGKIHLQARQAAALGNQCAAIQDADGAVAGVLDGHGQG
jgi:hypothetical protein